MKRSSIALLSALAAVALFTGVTRTAQAGTHTTEYPGVPLDWPAPVSGEMLSELRGGFDLGNGMLVSFGISRLVYINGNLVAGTSIHIPDLSHIDSLQAGALAALVGGTTLVRNGPGNLVAPGSFGQAIGAIVIQNTLNNQQIRTRTVVDAAVKNLNQFNSMNLADGLQRGLVDSRGR